MIELTSVGVISSQVLYFEPCLFIVVQLCAVMYFGCISKFDFIAFWNGAETGIEKWGWIGCTVSLMLWLKSWLQRRDETALHQELFISTTPLKIELQDWPFLLPKHQILSMVVQWQQVWPGQEHWECISTWLILATSITVSTLWINLDYFFF